MLKWSLEENTNLIVRFCCKYNPAEIVNTFMLFFDTVTTNVSHIDFFFCSWFSVSPLHRDKKFYIQQSIPLAERLPFISNKSLKNYDFSASSKINKLCLILTKKRT